MFSQNSSLTMQDSACLDARQIGVQASGGAARIERTTILGVRADEAAHGGIGLATIPFGGASQLDLVDVAIADVFDTGVFVGGSAARARRRGA